MIETHRLDDRHHRLRDDIGRVIPAAEPHFEHHRIGAVARESEKHRRIGDLEISDRASAIDALHFLQRRGEFGLGNEFAGDPDAFVKAHEMRRDVNVHAQPLRFKHGARKGADRAFAVGAGDMDHRRKLFLGIAEIIEQTLNAPEREIDLLGMKLQQPFENRRAFAVVDVLVEAAHSAALEPTMAEASGTRRVDVAVTVTIGGTGTGRERGRDLFMTRWTSFESAGRNSWRGTTMSIMPCSSRYSAR